MVQSTAATVAGYLADMPDDPRDAIEAVRDVILANLQPGFEEHMRWGMICYEVPLAVEPDTYNGEPLMYAALGNQKRHMAVYLTTVSADGDTEDWFREQYLATGKKLDMGKSCVRFTKLEVLPVELIGEVIGRTSVDDFVKTSHQARGGS
jgi:hypothetical protein